MNVSCSYLRVINLVMKTIYKKVLLIRDFNSKVNDQTKNAAVKLSKLPTCQHLTDRRMPAIFLGGQRTYTPMLIT